MNSSRYLPQPTSHAGYHYRKHTALARVPYGPYQQSNACETTTDPEVFSIADTASQSESVSSSGSQSTISTAVSDLGSDASHHAMEYYGPSPDSIESDMMPCIPEPIYYSRPCRQRPRNFSKETLLAMKTWMKKVRRRNVCRLSTQMTD